MLIPKERAMSWYEEIFRKVHLDFDTPEYVYDVGQKFSAGKFIEELNKAKVQAVQFYAKGADGRSFYDTRIGIKHGHLRTDLLREISEACHENGIKIMFYYSCGVDDYMARAHSNWSMNDGKENLVWDACNCGLVCFNSPYTDEIVVPQLEELTKNYMVNGFFLDHVWEFPCHCSYCQEKFERKYGSNIPKDRQDPLWFDYIKWRHGDVEDFLRKCANTVHKIKPEVVIGCNGIFSARHPRPPIEEIDYLMAEAEGGQACSFQARYLSTLEKPFDVMNTRFLHSWGDWMLKPANVLQEEFGTILANGGHCFLGDKMYPDGTLEPEVYQGIHQSYQFVEKREKLCQDQRPVPYIGILHSSSTFYSQEIAALGTYQLKGLASIQGAHKALMEGNFHFSIVNEDTLVRTIKFYHTLILPDQSHLSRELIEQIREFVYNGGAVIASHKTSLWNQKGKSTGQFQLSDVLGIKYERECPYPYNYIRVEDVSIKEHIGNLPLLVHGKFLYTKPTTATTLSSLIHPLAPEHSFERFAFGYAPPGKESGFPTVTLNHYGKGKAVYISGQIFRTFWEKKQVQLRYLIKNLVNLITDDKLIEVRAPPCIEVSFFKGKATYIAHLVNHGSGMSDIYEILDGEIGHVNDYILPVFGIQMKIKLQRHPEKVTQMPDERDLSWRRSGNYIIFEVPSVNIHSWIVIQ